MFNGTEGMNKQILLLRLLRGHVDARCCSRPRKASIVARLISIHTAAWPLLLASLPAVPAAPYNVGCVQLTGFLSSLPGGDSRSTGDTHVAACQRWHRIK